MAHVYTDRALRLAEIIDRGPGTVAIINDCFDIRWLIGFTGSNGWLVVTSQGFHLLTDGRYTAQARSQVEVSGVEVAVIECRTQNDMLQSISQLTSGQAFVQFQDASITHRLFLSMDAATEGELEPFDQSIRHMRRIKDAQELFLIEKACRIADAALADCLELLCQEITEIDFRDEIDSKMRLLGADGPSYDTIVASGPVNAARPHHQPTSTVIELGHTVIIDVGALVEGYHSDMTRSFVVGPMSSEQSHLYQVVQAAQDAGVESMGPGTDVRKVDESCRQIFRVAGLEEYFIHGTGHGVGLQIHEEPFINSSNSTILQVGEVVTVEPGLYRSGFGGFRVEDLVLVTQTGRRILNTSPKDPICLPSRPMT